MALPTVAVTAITTLQAAIKTAQAASPGGSIANASIATLQPVIIAAQTAYQVINSVALAAEAEIVGINLDTISGASVQDGINAFMSEMSNCAEDSDVVTARAYIGRIVGNLTLAGG